VAGQIEKEVDIKKMQSFVEKKPTSGYEKAPADDINDSVHNANQGSSSDQKKLGDLLKSISDKEAEIKKIMDSAQSGSNADGKGGYNW